MTKTMKITLMLVVGLLAGLGAFSGLKWAHDNRSAPKVDRQIHQELTQADPTVDSHVLSVAETEAQMQQRIESKVESFGLTQDKLISPVVCFDAGDVVNPLDLNCEVATVSGLVYMHVTRDDVGGWTSRQVAHW